MSQKRYKGSCHCGAVRYEVDLDFSRGTTRCNCSICTKARAWFTFVNAGQLHMQAGEEAMAEYRWIHPEERSRFSLTASAKPAVFASMQLARLISWAEGFTLSPWPHWMMLTPKNSQKRL
jgi:hypothetical protein